MKKLPILSKMSRKFDSALPNVIKAIALIFLILPVNGMALAKRHVYNRPQTEVADLIKQALTAPQNSCVSVKPVYSGKGQTVIDFGAKPNDGNDDSQAFQAMLDANHDLVIPEGTYNINKSVIVKMKKNVQIFGLGTVNLVSGDQKKTGIFSISASTGVLISNITFIGTAAKPDCQNTGIFFGSKDNDYVGVFDCKFTDKDGAGLNIGINAQNGSSHFIASGCTFNNLVGTTSGNGYGILVAYTTDSKICNNVFTGSSGNGRHAVYLSAGDENILVIGNTMSGFNSASIMFNCYTYQPENKNNIIKNNTITGGPDPSNRVGQITVFGKCWNNIIDSNKLNGSKQMGIFVSGNSGPKFDAANVGRGAKIMNNTIENSGTYGIAISGANNVDLINNKIDNAGSNDDRGNGYTAIYISSNIYDKVLPPAHDIRLKNNVVTGKNTRSPLSMDKGSKNKPYNIDIDKTNVLPKMRVSGVE